MSEGYWTPRADDDVAYEEHRRRVHEQDDDEEKEKEEEQNGIDWLEQDGDTNTIRDRL